MANKIGTSASEVNSALERMGLQTQVEVEVEGGKAKKYKWVATPEGEKVSRIVKGNRGTLAYEMVCWLPSVLDQLGYVRPPSRSEFEALQAKVDALQTKLEVLYIITGHATSK